ncbi:hypothetical protein ES703_91009 [subsurface metagenome]
MAWEDARFCFVAYQDLEQNEPGDTFTHTFTWLGWLHCETRYFYFWATWMGERMISTSPIFYKHYVAPKVFTALAVFLDFDATSGRLTGYINAHNAPGLSSRDNWTSVTCSQLLVSRDRWQLYRAAFVFDTLELDPSWSFVTATLHYNVGILYNEGGGPLDFLDGKGLTLPHYPGSYAEIRTKTNILAQVDRGDIDAGVWRESVLDPTKLAFLNPGGLTIIAIREHHDVMISDAGPPEGQTWGFGLHTFESPIGGPWLYITAE